MPKKIGVYLIVTLATVGLASARENRPFPQWTPRSPIPIPVSSPAVGVIDGIIYLAGGSGPASSPWGFLGTAPPRSTQVLQAYDPKTDKWTRKSDLPGEAMYLSGCTLDGIFYVINGFENEKVFAYDPKTDKWQAKASLPMQPTTPGQVLFSRRCAGSYDGFVYAVGGDGIYRYSPALDYWEKTDSPGIRLGYVDGFDPRDLPGKYGGLSRVGTALDSSITMSGDKILVVGSEVRGISVGSLEWQTLITMADPVGVPGLTASGSHLYLVGGRHGFSSLRIAIDFDLERGSQRLIDPYPRPIDGAGLAMVDGTLYSFGGGVISSAAVEAYTPSMDEAEPAPDHGFMAAPSSGSSYFEYPTRRAGTPRSKDYAMVIGLERYQSLPNSPGATNDAASIAAFLQHGLGLPKENVIFLTGERASRADWESYIDEWLPKNLSPDSRLYFYFAGYGAVGPSGQQSYLLPWDADISFLSSTAYPLNQLFERMSALKARDVVMIFDCCFGRESERCRAPRGLRPLLNVIDPGPGADSKLTVLFATTGSESAAVLPTKDRGVFTDAIISGLEGSVQSKRGSTLTVEQLFHYTNAAVQKQAGAKGEKQSPRLISKRKGLRIY